MKLGDEGEEIAMHYLKKRGYKIIERNHKNTFGEVDIIALHKGTLVFIEVKTRRTYEYGMPFEAVNHRKQEKLKKVALMYLKRLKKEVPARFDVVSISFEEGETDIELIPDAFEL